jgi:hypothetical protein
MTRAESGAPDSVSAIACVDCVDGGGCIDIDIYYMIYIISVVIPYDGNAVRIFVEYRTARSRFVDNLVTDVERQGSSGCGAERYTEDMESTFIPVGNMAVQPTQAGPPILTLSNGIVGSTRGNQRRQEDAEGKGVIRRETDQELRSCAY